MACWVPKGLKIALREIVDARTAFLRPCCADRNEERQQKVFDLYGGYMYDEFDMGDLYKLK